MTVNTRGEFGNIIVSGGVIEPTRKNTHQSEFSAVIGKDSRFANEEEKRLFSF